MSTYVTFFSVGKDSEALIIDQLKEDWDKVVVWESKERYFSARLEPNPKHIDGGIYSYMIACGMSLAPDDMFNGRIVSYQAPSSLVRLLLAFDEAVQALRFADWPDWEAEAH